MRTFAIIKPDAVAAGHTGEIISMIEKSGFKIVVMGKDMCQETLARKFYGVHQQMPFYENLVKFMTDRPFVSMVLEKENAVQAWRELMGPTNPVNAGPETIRGRFGKGMPDNAVHGSDCIENAVAEINLFFPWFWYRYQVDESQTG